MSQTDTTVKTEANYYWLLGLELYATQTQINDAYRRALRLLDVGIQIWFNKDPLQVAQLRADIDEAYLCLSDPARREQYDRTATAPTAEDGKPFPTEAAFETQGVQCVLSYEIVGSVFRREQIVYTIPQDGLLSLKYLPGYSSFGFGNSYVVRVVDADNNVIIDTYSLEFAQRRYRDVLRERRLDEYRKDVTVYEARRREFIAQGLPTTDLLIFIQKLKSATVPYAYVGRNKSVFDVAAEAKRKIEAEIARLEGDPERIILDGVLNGKIKHPHLNENLLVLGEVGVWSLRTNGFVDEVGEGWLYDFYAERLKGATTEHEALRRDLRLNLADFVDPEFVQAAVELEGLELAPDQVELQNRKGTLSAYPVTYSYMEVGGEQIESRVKKYKGGKARGKSVQAEEEILPGLTLRRRGPIEAEQPPPWFVGHLRRR